MDDVSLKQIQNFESEVEQGLRIRELGKTINEHLNTHKTLPEEETLDLFIKEAKRFI